MTPEAPNYLLAHIAQFLIITLIASLVYHALRVDDLKAAALAGMKRFASCVVIASIAMFLVQLFTRWV